MIDIAATIAAMQLAGLDDAQIVRALGSIRTVEPPVNRIAPPVNKSAERTARWRARKASQNVTERHGDVTVTNNPSPLIPPLSPAPLSPPIIPPPENIRGTRLSDDFLPDQSCHDLAKELGMSEIEFQNHFDSFLDYFRSVPGARGRKIKWQMTFRNWLRNSRKSYGKPVKTNSRAANFAELDELIRRAEPGEDSEGGGSGETTVIDATGLWQRTA